MPTRQEVSSFLQEIGTAIKFGHFCWLPRPDAFQGLVDLSINQRIALEIICDLTTDAYSTGPEPDVYCPEREVWVFGADVEGIEAYIKLALQPVAKTSVVNGLVWSFHPSKYPVNYPLRGSTS